FFTTHTTSPAISTLSLHDALPISYRLASETNARARLRSRRLKTNTRNAAAQESIRYRGPKCKAPACCPKNATDSQKAASPLGTARSKRHECHSCSARDNRGLNPAQMRREKIA